MRGEKGGGGGEVSGDKCGERRGEET
jgi:hypothetical protein